MCAAWQENFFMCIYMYIIATCSSCGFDPDIPISLSKCFCSCHAVFVCGWYVYRTWGACGKPSKCTLIHMFTHRPTACVGEQLSVSTPISTHNYTFNFAHSRVAGLNMYMCTMCIHYCTAFTVLYVYMCT